MNAQTGWLALNQRYLMAEAARVRRALEQTAGLAGDPPGPAPEPSMLDFADMTRRPRWSAWLRRLACHRSSAMCCCSAPRPSWMAVSRRSAPVRPAILTRPYPTFGLALTALAEPHWSALAPVAPLRRWRLVELVNAGFEPLATTRLRIDERVLHHLAGLDYLDERLAATAKFIMSTDEFDTGTGGVGRIARGATGQTNGRGRASSSAGTTGQANASSPRPPAARSAARSTSWLWPTSRPSAQEREI